MSETSEPRRRRRRAARQPGRPRAVLKIGLLTAGLSLGAAVALNFASQTGRLKPTATEQVREAWAVLSSPPAQRDVEKAETLARSALAREPLQSRAASLLAVVAEEAGDREAATRLMRAASRLSRRDDVADYWLFDHELKAGNAEAAALHADALLRREFLVVENHLYPRMVAAFANEQFAAALAQRLVKRPPWRSHFLQFANANLQNPQAVFVIFSAIQKAGGRLTPEELAPYYRRLLAAGQYDQAYLSWILFLPQETVSKLQNVYDGDFDGWPEWPPFGWSFVPGVRGSVEPADAYGREGMAMRVDYDGIGTPTMPSQILLLSPGHYRLSGLALTATAQSAGRVALSVACDKGEALLAPVSIADTGGAWRKFAADFTVPDSCKGQVLSVVPTPGGQRASVEVWFDQIAIDRVDPTNE